jgi:hypothetical protein
MHSETFLNNIQPEKCDMCITCFDVNAIYVKVIMLAVLCKYAEFNLK